MQNSNLHPKYLATAGVVAYSLSVNTYRVSEIMTFFTMIAVIISLFRNSMIKPKIV